MKLETPDTAYRAASFSLAETASWLPFAGSADSELLPEHGALVSRARDLSRNNGVAAGSIQTLVDNVVGTGFTLSAKPDYRALGKSKSWADGWALEAEAAWRAWADTVDCDAARRLNFHGQTQLVFRTQVVQGEALALALWLPGRNGRYATTLQLVDPDRLSNPSGRLDGARLRGGIETDAFDAPVAYHIRRSHPRDVGLWSVGLGSAGEWERVPAAMPFGRRRVLHVHDIPRTGQSRGRPSMTAVMPMFRTLDLYQSAELQAAVVNAMIAAIIENSAKMEDVVQVLGGTPDEYFERRSEHKVQLKGGTMPVLFPGDSVKPFIPSRPNAQFGQFSESVLRNIGTAIGLPLELLMKDFSKTNYSSARAALLEAWRYFNCRRDALTTYWCDPVYALWLEEAANAGVVKTPDFYANRAAWCRCEWVGDGRGWVDPLKEAEASAARRAAGVSTLAIEAAEQGRDWQALVDQRITEEVYENEARRKAGLDPSAPPGGKPVPSRREEAEEPIAA